MTAAPPPVAPRTRWAGLDRGRLLCLADRGGCLLFALLLFVASVPWAPMTDTRYVEYLLHVAAAQGLQHGTEVILTYGPLGFATLPFYCPATYPAAIVVNVGYFLLTLGLGYRCVRLSAVAPGIPVCLWPLLLGLLPTALLSREWGALLVWSHLLLVLAVLAHFGPTPPRPLPALLLGLALGPLVWTKGTLAVLGALTLACLALDASVGQRRPPWLALGGAAGALLAWVALGQPLGAVADYLRGLRSVATGYRETMCLWDAESTRHALFFAAAGLLVAGAVAGAWWRTLRWRLPLLWLPLAALVGMLFLEAFVRPDRLPGIHQAGTIPTLAAVAGLLWLGLPAALAARRWRWAVLLTTATALASLVWASDSGSGPLARRAAHVFQNRVCEPWAALLARGGTAPASAAAHDTQPAADGLPLDCDSVEVPSGDPRVAVAKGLALRLRPTLVSYSAYTPDLARSNRQFLESSAAATCVLFSPPAIDGEYPTLMDNRAFLSLRTHYRVTGVVPDYLVLRRRAAPGSWRLVPLRQCAAKWDEPVPVPPADAGPVWVTVRWRRNAWGEAVALGFKAPPVNLQVSLAEPAGTWLSHRVCRDMAADGFLLSPYLNNLAAFACFYAADPHPGCPAATPAVRELKLTAPDAGWLTGPGGFAGDLQIAFFRIEFQPPPAP